MSISAEHLTQSPTLHEKWAHFMDQKPITISSMISRVVPTNGKEERERYLAGEISQPHHHYDGLADVDDTMIERLEQAGRYLLEDDIPPKYRQTYEEVVTASLDRARMLNCMREYTAATTPEEKQQLKEEFMSYNERLFGVPDETIYRSILKEKIDTIRAKELTGRAAELRDELLAQVGNTTEWKTVERFRPSAETVAWAHQLFTSLFEGMLRHVPEDQELFDIYAIKAVFEAVMREEFGEAAEGWMVVIEPAATITVKANEKRIVIPDNRKPVSRKELRELVSHELGIHFMRSVMGGETDLEPLAIGIEGYYDPEEGMGSGTAQALAGNYTEAGVPAYLTIGAMYFDKMSFDETVALKWKIAALEAIKPGQDLDESMIAAKRSQAYDGVNRITRGTDELPWFKDLGYYNGNKKFWKKMEEICGDDFQFVLMMLGRTDYTSREQRNVVLETRTV